MASSDKHSEFDVVISAESRNRQYWRDLWRYRELFYFLAWRDILVRYKQTTIGVTWALIRPLFTMVVFTIVFGGIAKLPSGSVPYPIMVFAALLPWQFVSSAFSEASNSLLGNANMVSKVYFPRMLVPLSSVLVCLVDFVIGMVVLAGLMVWYDVPPGIRILTLPLLVLFSIALVLGPSLWVAALNVKYRDFRYVVPFLVQAGLYVSPVGFSSDVVQEKWRLIYSINPMVGVIDGFRWAIFGQEVHLYWPGLLLSILFSGMLLILGIRYFRNAERSFVDVI